MSRRVGFLGPPGTFTEEVMRAGGIDGLEPLALPTVYDAVMAVHDGRAERSIVPIENSLEGSVNATLDALAVEARDVAIVGEAVHAVRHCLIAARSIELGTIERVVSHPQANAQCARFLREQLPGARVEATASTADAVRAVAESPDEPWAALGTRLAAGLYGCEVLQAGVEDEAANETRFVWLARRDAPRPEGGGDAAWKTSIVFWGAGDEGPGWLVRCLSEFAFRGVNLTKIESRPRRQGLGHYMFFADLGGHADEPTVAQALDALAAQCEEVRTLGSYPAAS